MPGGLPRNNTHIYTHTHIEAYPITAHIHTYPRNPLDRIKVVFMQVSRKAGRVLPMIHWWLSFPSLLQLGPCFKSPSHPR